MGYFGGIRILVCDGVPSGIFYSGWYLPNYALSHVNNSSVMEPLANEQTNDKASYSNNDRELMKQNTQLK